MSSRSLKVIESDTIWKLGYGFLFAFHSNYGRICSHFGDIQRQRMAWPWNLGLASVKDSRSLRMAPFDRPRMTLLVGLSHCNYSSIMYHLRVIWRLIIRWPWNMAKRSLKIIETGAIQKLGCGFLFVFHSNLWPYLQPFWRYSASNNGLTLKCEFGFVQGHWKWRRSIDHVWLSISPPL